MNPPPPWREDWFNAARPLGMRAWRAVEAQHVVATMRLVDSLEEQAVLERLLENSKPRLPSTAVKQHFLLTTPFRYAPAHGSRFRRAGTKGIWYGAATVKTAVAEVAYWRWRFLCDSERLRETELLTEHTVFAATVEGRAIDLTEPPWVQAQASWRHASAYGDTQALGQAADERAIDWLRYASVRDPGGICCAVLRPGALLGPDMASQQTWHCRTTRQMVRMVHQAERCEWAVGDDLPIP